jgi:hypothetical protein
MTDDLDLYLKSYVIPPNLKERRYTFRRMSHPTHLTSNSLQMFMINQSRYILRRSLMIIATLIPTAVSLLLVNHNHPRFRRNMREQIAIRTLHAPLWMTISMAAIITTAIMAMTMTATMVTITIDSDHHLLSIGVQLAVHPWLRMYTLMVIRDRDLSHASHPSALPVKGFLYGSIQSPRGAATSEGSQAFRKPHVNGVHKNEDVDGQASVTDSESVEGVSEQDSLTSVE